MVIPHYRYGKYRFFQVKSQTIINHDPRCPVTLPAIGSAAPPGVSKIELRTLHQAFGCIVEERHQYADHEGSSHDVDIFADGHVGYAESAADFRVIQDLSVVMGQHGPETPQGGCRDADAQLRIPFQKGGDVIFPPQHAQIVVGSQKRLREAATQPQSGLVRRTNVGDGKSSELVEADPSGQRLAAGHDQVTGCIAQNQVSLLGVAVDQDPQQGEQVRTTLNFIDDDETVQTLQEQLGGVETLPGRADFPDRNGDPPSGPWPGWFSRIDGPPGSFATSTTWYH